jgi:hypothetical protein
MTINRPPEPPRGDTIMRTSLIPDNQWLHGEPTLEELLAEPIVRLAAEKDRVSIDELRDQLLRFQDRAGKAL